MRPGLVSVAVLAGALGVGLVAFYVWKKGGVTGAAKAAGTAAVDAAVGVSSGVVGGIGSAVGLPTPDETTTDPAVSRWIIDNYGWFTATKWSGAVALARAMMMGEGSGTPPPAGSAIAEALPVIEVPALLRRPAEPVQGIYSRPGGVPESIYNTSYPAGVPESIYTRRR
jgi:hypothetical protein